MSKNRIRESLKWLATLAVVLMVLGFAADDRRQSVCRTLDVSVEELSGIYFIDETSVIERVFDLGDPIIGTPIDSLNLRKIRRAIVELPSVKDATVYARVDGKLAVQVTQRRPLFRVIGNGHAGYYVDTEGKPMPLSGNYSARVPVVTGAIPTDFYRDPVKLAENERLKETFGLVKFLEKDPFWSAQTEHIVILPNGEFELIPRVGSARIHIGKSVDLEDKFKRLKVFYLNMAANNNINQYKKINVKYRDQVVCERFF